MIDNHLPVFSRTHLSEVMAAMEYNLPVVKFFPAVHVEDLNDKALAAPFPSLKFMPTEESTLRMYCSWL
ncbi:MAG: hypothetical protein ACLVJO_03960 [[Clostridium] scindens]